METRQLVLIADEPSHDWRLDDHTRQVGLAGIAAARDALRAARGHRPEPEAGRPADPHQPHAA